MSVPEPIVLNEFGEALDFDTSFRNDKGMDLRECSATHLRYRGSISFLPISETHFSIHCSHCGRIPNPACIPSKIVNIDQLRQWCADRIAQEQKEKEFIAARVSSQDIIEKDKRKREIEAAGSG